MNSNFEKGRGVLGTPAILVRLFCATWALWLICQPINALACDGGLRHMKTMAKLYFHYSTMNAGKSTLLLQASYNYIERGMQTYLLTADFDNRTGPAKIGSRIGIEAKADTYSASCDLFDKIRARLAHGPCACVLIDEAQWLTRDQVWQLARVVDDLGVPIMCYGLRVDFRGELFEGSAALLALADEMREVRTICHCGKKATMVIRVDENGHAVTHGDQIEVGGNERYVALCRAHFREAIGDRPVALDRPPQTQTPMPDDTNGLP
jgi:thymidine kinase